MIVYCYVHVVVLYTMGKVWSGACNHGANIWELPTRFYNVICVLPDYLLEHSDWSQHYLQLIIRANSFEHTASMPSQGRTFMHSSTYDKCHKNNCQHNTLIIILLCSVHVHGISYTTPFSLLEQLYIEHIQVL